MMEQGEISPHLRKKAGCRGNPTCGCCYRAAGCPTAGERKAEHAAEANGDGPLAVQQGGSSGNAGPPDLLTSDFPSCSSPAPKDRRHGTDTLLPPDILQGVHTCVCVRTLLTALAGHKHSRAHPSQSYQAS